MHFSGRTWFYFTILYTVLYTVHNTVYGTLVPLYCKPQNFSKLRSWKKFVCQNAVGKCWFELCFSSMEVNHFSYLLIRAEFHFVDSFLRMMLLVVQLLCLKISSIADDFNASHVFLICQYTYQFLMVYINIFVSEMTNWNLARQTSKVAISFSFY